MGHKQEPVAGLADQPWLGVFRAMSRGVDAVLVVDEAGMVQRLNRPIGGIDPATLCASPLWTHMAQHKDSVRAALRHAFHPGLSQTVRAPVRAGTGVRWYRFHIMPVEDVAFVQCTDVDAEHRKMERLQGSERMMRDAEGMSHLGTWYWDITEPHARWSDELYRIYGLDPADHVPTYEDYLSRVHPDDVERVKAATESVFNDHESYSHDERIRHTDGSWRHLHTWARPVLDDEGRLVALQGVCLDVTERKAAEEALARNEARQSAMLAAAGLGIASLMPDGTIEDANPRFTGLVGEGDTLQGLVPEAAQALEAALQDPEHAHRLTATTRDGERTLRFVFTVADEEPDPFIVVVAQDATAEAKAEEAQRRIDDLEAKQIEQARIVGVASHEMKNPMTPIVAQLHMLQHGMLGQLNDEQERAIRRVEGQFRRLDALIRDLLDAARSGEGTLQIRAGPCDLRQLVHDAVARHLPVAEEYGVAIELELPDEAPAHVDGARIAQVVDNLLSNALRFTPSGKTVRVALDAVDGWRITVADDGPGIPEAARDQVFDAYGTAPGEPAHPEPSTGLGLFISRSIVEAHGGRIAVEPTDQGTTIVAELPAPAL